MEYITITDENDKPIGKKDLKEAHFQNLWHRASHVWIYNSKGEVFLQKRAAVKFYYPDFFDISAAGHIDHKEKPLDCAQREVKEELGIKFEKKDFDFLGVIKKSKKTKDFVDNEHYYVYLLRYDGNPCDFKLQKKEVSFIKIVTVEQFEKEIDADRKNRKYVPHGRLYYNMVIREIKKRIKK